MNYKHRSLRPPGELVFLAVVVSIGAGEVEIDRNSADCGPVALYALLQLERRSTALEVITARLPAPRPGGHSMKDLRDAARSFGLRLDGAFLGKDSGAIDRPMLAFLKVERAGHFLVIRPVGHTGKLVQVIDSNQPTRVMDKDDLVTSIQWTGLVLAPRRSNWLVLAAIGLLTPSALCVFAIAFFRGRRARLRETTSKI